MKINLWLLIFCILTTSAVWAQQAGSDNDDYALELVKHYLAKEKIDLALQAALQNQDQTSQPDSLAWLTASIY
jgi:hypothetical protein